MENLTYAPPPVEEVLVSSLRELRSLVSDLHRPKICDHEWVQAILSCSRRVFRKLEVLREALRQRRQIVPRALLDLCLELTQLIQDLSTRCTRTRLRQLRARLARSHEELCTQLERMKLVTALSADAVSEVRFPRIGRAIFHMSCGLISVLLYELLLSRDQALVVLAAVLVLMGVGEISRRLIPRWNEFLMRRVFGPIARPAERYRISSATYYTVALALIVMFAPRTVVNQAILVLAFGDPMASLVGHRYGGWRFRNDKSAVGSLAFLGASFVACWVYLLTARNNGLLAVSLLSTLCICLTGSLVELVSGRIDDNLTIPVACALVGMFLG